MREIREWCQDCLLALFITTILYWIIKAVGLWQLLYLILKAIADNN